MYKGKRGWVGISINILEASLLPLNKTRLMYRSNLNYARFNAYFHDFLRKGLIEEAKKEVNGHVKLFVISEQGKILLAALKKAEDILAQTQAQA